MSEPAVTVVVPTYDRPRQLQACLDALALQTLSEPWEVVVVDDGSPRPLAGLAELFAGRLALRVVRQANCGPAEARNRGVAEAGGEYVAFTDDDCRPEPAWLETLLVAARGRPGSLVGGRTWNGLPDELFASTSQLIVDLVYEHFNADPDAAYFFASNNMLCPRERFVALGGYDRRFPRAGAEDRDFCDRWRVSGWPLVWREGARVEHRHSQSLRGFIDLHFRYGRGARLYQAMRRARRSGTMRDDLGFHATLMRRVGRRAAADGGRWRWGTVVACLALWQVANAAGFATEAIVGSRGSGGP
jgi:GT2 family glycosyltransferase